MSFPAMEFADNRQLATQPSIGKTWAGTETEIKSPARENPEAGILVS
jgi:hypothetical protein